LYTATAPSAWATPWGLVTVVWLSVITVPLIVVGPSSSRAEPLFPTSAVVATVAVTVLWLITLSRMVRRWPGPSCR
jgi:hypothetical protein